MITIQCDDLSGTGGSMVGYLHDVSLEMPNRDSRPAVIICPGGGYEFLSAREADPPATFFLSHGYNVFVLRSSVRLPGTPPLKLAPLTQVSAAVMEVRLRCAEWHCDPDKIAVCGFSAGGHLAGSISVLWNSPELRAIQDTKDGLNKPNAAILGYPVITSGKMAHKGSFYALAEDDLTLWALFSLENQVTASAAPTFLWHTMADDCVPVENSMMMAAALHAAQVPVECHLYQKGGHGLSVCSLETGSKNVQCATWLPLCIAWLNDLFDFQE